MERIQPERSARRRLGVILLVMTACTGGGVSSTPTTANSSPVAATTGTSSTTPVLETAVELPGEFEPIAPGTYSADTDGDEATATRGTFSIEDDGWLSLGGGVMKDTPAGVDGGLYVSLLVVEIDQVWEDPCNGESPVPAGSSAEGLGGQLAALPEFTTQAELAPVSAFGQDGYHLVLEVPDNCDTEENMVWEGPTWGRYFQAEGQIADYWFFDVEGAPVIVETTRPPQSDDTTATALAAELDMVLETLVISP